MIVLVALFLIISMMYLLLKNKISPIVAFIILPILAGIILIMIESLTRVENQTFLLKINNLIEWSTSGVETTMPNATLFIFSIIYFGIMSDAGMFDPIIKGLVKVAGKNPTMIYLTTALIALVSQLDGATATTYLVTIPAMLPIFKRLKLNVLGMLSVIGIVTGSWNMVPWGGTIIRTATTLTNLGYQVTPQKLWIKILPIEILGMILGIILAIYFGVQDKKKLMKKYGENFFELSIIDEIKIEEKNKEITRPKLVYINLFLTAIIIILMILNSNIPSYLVFLVATGIALLINYKGLKLQNERVNAHATTAIGTAATFLAAGVFLGIFKETKMTIALANIILKNLPDFILLQIGRIFGILGAAIGIILSPDLYYYSLLPVVGEVIKTLGGNPIKAALAMLIGENIGVIVSPCIPTTFLAIGLAGVELKDHIKFSLKYLILVSLIMIIVAAAFGIV